MSLLKLIYKFNAITNNIYPNKIFYRTWKDDFKFHLEEKCKRRAQNIFQKKVPNYIIKLQ